MLPEFDLLMPRTLPEALAMLAEGAPDAAPIAGGTNLIPDMRSGLRHPSAVVNIAGLEELRAIRRENGHVIVGSGVTIAELLDSPLIAEHAPALRQATATFANPMVRNRATVGGNLGNASPAADTAPPLLVLGAEVELACIDGTRTVPLEEFFVHVRDTVCRPAELVTSIRWPAPARGSANGFRKIALRKAEAIAVVSVAAMVVPDEAGYCRQVRVAMGAVAPTPIRARAVEDALRDQPLTPETIAKAADLAASATCCIDDIRGSGAYRQRVVGVLTQRLLADLAREIR